ncbi:MAG: hypothetical protein MUC41_03750 [Syntrophobacteraceae bacterium]|jgi:hypothetical protein|nr:hypothetical protein [Syntrophobacteraceae bacterium]
MIRLLIYGFLIYLVVRIVKSLGRSLTGPDEDVGDVPRSENTELIRDPQCGTYFLRQQGVQARIGGQRLHFCSERCRDEYLRDHGMR